MNRANNWLARLAFKIPSHIDLPEVRSADRAGGQICSAKTMMSDALVVFNTRCRLCRFPLQFMNCRSNPAASAWRYLAGIARRGLLFHAPDRLHRS